jgi:tetratricopeptide (TPR) repeat protein
MKLPDPLKKGLLLYGDRAHAPAEPERLAEYGAAYESEGRVTDALEFYRRAGLTEGIERIAAAAVSAGDFFLYRQAAAYLGRAMAARELSTLGKNAEERGKLAFALAAAREARDDRRAAALAERMSQGDGDGKEQP